MTWFGGSAWPSLNTLVDSCKYKLARKIQDNIVQCFHCVCLLCSGPAESDEVQPRRDQRIFGGRQGDGHGRSSRPSTHHRIQSFGEGVHYGYEDSQGNRGGSRLHDVSKHAMVYTISLSGLANIPNDIFFGDECSNKVISACMHDIYGKHWISDFRSRYSTCI